MLSIEAVLEHPRKDRMISTLVLVTCPPMRTKSSAVLMKMMSALSQVKESQTWKVNRYVLLIVSTFVFVGLSSKTLVSFHETFFKFMFNYYYKVALRCYPVSKYISPRDC
jgi:hypothetical protein